MVKFLFAFSYLTFFFSYTPSYASADHSFVDVQIETGKQLTRKASPAYLECYDARSSAEKKLALRSFYIKPVAGEFKDVVVGKISTKYEASKKRVEIGHIEKLTPNTSARVMAKLRFVLFLEFTALKNIRI